MRAYECSLTAEGKTALLEFLIATEQPVRIRRLGEREEWRLGGWFRYEWCIFSKQAGSDLWSVTFGGNFKMPKILEPLFTKTVSSHRGCCWIWPERSYAA
jgi:hypothetical protein